MSGPTVRELLTEGARTLQASSESPVLDARVLLAHVAGIPAALLLARDTDSVATEHASAYRALIARRAEHEPIAYLVGEKEFFGIPFAVTPAVLIPRPETELVVERILAQARLRSDPVSLLDLGTGSGCIAAAAASLLAKEGRRFSALAVDESAEALAVAAANVLRAEAGRVVPPGCIELLRSSWFSAIPGERRFSIIASNPPYIADGDVLAKDLSREPRAALRAGKDGLDAFRAILPELRSRLEPDGVFIAEMGAGQRAAFAALAASALGPKCRVEFFEDLAGLDRVAEITFPP